MNEETMYIIWTVWAIPSKCIIYVFILAVPQYMEVTGLGMEPVLRQQPEPQQ